LYQEFGYIPSKIYVAVGKYQTDNGGALQNQIPASQNADGNIDFIEFYEYIILQEIKLNIKVYLQGAYR